MGVVMRTRRGGGSGGGGTGVALLIDGEPLTIDGVEVLI